LVLSGDDEPTRQVPPARPRQPSPPAGGGSQLPPESHIRTWEEELADRISSLKNWVVMLAIISVAAIGVAVYAVVVANNADTSSGSKVTQSQIDDIESKISELQDSSASDEAITQLKSEVSDLSDEVDKLQSADSGTDAVSAQDFSDLQQQVSDLSQQVADLQGQPTQ
jgi:polyhydroxyalkanoate synthesis regulator phasin